jgi:hypothetical protein
MQYAECTLGGPHPVLDYPFCPECGALSPAISAQGAFAVELEDIPSEQIRARVIDGLKNWYPGIDPVEADARLKSGPVVLLRSIDEDSARRALAYLNAYKAPGRISGDQSLDSWMSIIWNPGLAIGAVALVAALLTGGLTGMALAAGGLGAMGIGAFLKRKRFQPLCRPSPSSEFDELKALADEYARVIPRLESEDAAVVNKIARTGFELRKRLLTDSVAAIAAGGRTGELYDRVTEAIRGAVHLGESILTSAGPDKESLRAELEGLMGLLARTDQWLDKAEGKLGPSSADLAQNLDHLTERIDRILDTVRTPVLDSVHPRPTETGHTRSRE